MHLIYLLDSLQSHAHIHLLLHVSVNFDVNNSPQAPQALINVIKNL